MTIRVVSPRIFLHDGCPKAVEGKPVVALIAYRGEAPPKFRCPACDKEWWAVPAPGPLTMPFCGLRMDAKVTSLSPDSWPSRQDVEKFIGDRLRDQKDFFIKVRMGAFMPPQRSYHGLYQVDYEFVMLQVCDPCDPDVVVKNQEAQEPPPIGSDW